MEPEFLLTDTNWTKMLWTFLYGRQHPESEVTHHQQKLKGTRDRSQIRVYTPPPVSTAPTDDNGRWWVPLHRLGVAVG